MLQLLAGKDAGESAGSVRCKRHRPEQTLLYRPIAEYYADFEMQYASEGKVIPDYVRQEFDAYLKCGRLERCQCTSPAFLALHTDTRDPVYYSRQPLILAA